MSQDSGHSTDEFQRTLADPSQFISVRVQFYRAAMDRSATWLHWPRLLNLSN